MLATVLVWAMLGQWNITETCQFKGTCPKPALTIVKLYRDDRLMAKFQSLADCERARPKVALSQWTCVEQP